ncbi:transcriptional regulator [Georgenia yuyongxinii]|uniref:transcriptional regulator n=1 Tax=Georgenia yuyongxinii TaxID=2589797 RepID=UPI001C8F9322|nr:transcriptional regulator [Georgenia yuyongxinii]
MEQGHGRGRHGAKGQDRQSSSLAERGGLAGLRDVGTPVGALDFATVREGLTASNSVLSKHVRVLPDAGYLHTSKTPNASRTRAWLALTDTGRAALDAHLAALRRIAAKATATA